MALNIVRGRVKTAVRAVIYGTEGIGKTTLAAAFPEPLFLDTEDGTSQLDVARVAVKSWTQLEGAFHDLIRNAQGFGSVVVDSADWAERLAKNFICQTHNKSSIEDFGYGKGMVKVGESISKLLDLADQLIEKGINVVFVAHAKTVRVSPPDQTDGYDRYELKMEKHSAPIFKEWADLVLFCNYRTTIVEGDDGRKKAKGGRDRVMYATRSPAFDAKNRYGLPAELPMTFAALAPAFAGGTQFRGLRKEEPYRVRSSTPQPEVEPPLAEQIRGHIVAAKDVRALGNMGNRIDELTSDGQLTIEEANDLTRLINERHNQIEPIHADGGLASREEVTA
ncbi:MAG: hypothetical protein RLZZ21_258 [Planctomycetota bacterium]|jgi:hypothetical protein